MYVALTSQFLDYNKQNKQEVIENKLVFFSCYLFQILPSRRRKTEIKHNMSYNVILSVMS